jgi:hypothetical protein
MKHFIGIGFLIILALIAGLSLFSPVGLDIHVHDTYRVIPLRIVGFWLLIGIAFVGFLVAAYKFARHAS